MKHLIILIIFFTNLTFSQERAGQLYYGTERPKIARLPVDEIIKANAEREKAYYENRDYCNQIERFLIESLQNLRIESINNIYREGLKRNLIKIQKLKEEGNYAEYSMLIMDIFDDIKSNALYYEDEDDYNNLLKEKLIKEEKENQRLREELEYQKSLNITTKPATNKKQLKKK